MSMFLKTRTEKNHFLTTNFLKVSLYFTEKGVGRVPHGSPLGTLMLLTGWEQRGQRNNICYRSGSLFTKSFRKFQLKSKWTTSFRIVPVENFNGNRMSEKVFLISWSATPTVHMSFVNKRCSF